jgi:hypothetical protein
LETFPENFPVTVKKVIIFCAKMESFPRHNPGGGALTSNTAIILHLRDKIKKLLFGGVIMKKFCSILLSVLLLTAFLTSCTPPPAETSAEAPAASSGPENTGGKIIITLLQFKIDIADRVMKMAEDFNNSQSQINLAATVEGD